MAESDSPIVLAQTTAAQALEHRLTLIEQSILNGFEKSELQRRTGMEQMTIQVNAVADQVRQQNGRIGSVEKWRAAVETAQAYVKGASEGAQKMGRGQLALLGIVGPLLFAAIELAVRNWR